MVTIRLGDLRVGTVSSSSGIFSGTNKLHRFKQVSKQNQAFGTVEGEHTLVVDHLSSLEDRDWADTVFSVHRPKP